MRHAALCLVLAVATAACVLPVDSGAPANDAVSGPHAPGEGAQAIAVRPLKLSAAAKRYVVIGARSRLDVSGHDSVLGDHVLSFDRWWAHIDADPLNALATPERVDVEEVAD